MIDLVSSLESATPNDIDQLKRFVSKEDLVTALFVLSFFESYFSNPDDFSNLAICYRNVKNGIYRFFKRYYQ